MQSITILIQQTDDGRTAIQHYVGGEIPPEIAAEACRYVATAFDGLAIEAEVQRRLEAARAEDQETQEMQ